LVGGEKLFTGVPAKKLVKSPSVWATFGGLVAETNAINLGQGFPDWDPPDFVRQSLKDAVDSQFHQYTRPAGHPALVELLASRYSYHLDRAVDPISEVAITVGASQALYLSLLTLMEEGDEVVMFDPYFELYAKQIESVGGIAKCVPLGGASATPEDPWALDAAALEGAVSGDTKVLILNSPHNPTGKVFSAQEMEAVAAIVRKYPGLKVLSDEVYKYTVYSPHARDDARDGGENTVVGHTHFARLPGMWDRTLTISSCGKTFSVTGWQVGWMVGPADLVSPVQEALPTLQFCVATPMQQALTGVLQQAETPYKDHDTYYEWLRHQFTNKRAILEKGMVAAGIEPVPAQGGYFLMGRLPTNHPGASKYARPGESYDFSFCRQLIAERGVASIPASPFFSGEHDPSITPYARFAFCKRDETLRDAVKRLSAPLGV
jgi:kynurenine--oxoglutarate transaminase/cysteine-S-conjugate beta-lyase/glutamine--phenylpyruvate transaminase